MNTQWVNIDRSEFAERSGMSGAGRKHFISPYALPEAVRAYESDDGAYIIFEFRYISIKENKIRKLLNSEVEFEIGATSKRIYKIIAKKELIDRERSDKRYSVEKMEDALDKFIANQERKELNTDAYSANKKIIHRYKEPLSQELSS